MQSGVLAAHSAMCECVGQPSSFQNGSFRAMPGLDGQRERRGPERERERARGPRTVSIPRTARYVQEKRRGTELAVCTFWFQLCFVCFEVGERVSAVRSPFSHGWKSRENHCSYQKTATSSGFNEIMRSSQSSHTKTKDTSIVRPRKLVHVESNTELRRWLL